MRKELSELEDLYLSVSNRVSGLKLDPRLLEKGVDHIITLEDAEQMAENGWRLVNRVRTLEKELRKAKK